MKKQYFVILLALSLLWTGCGAQDASLPADHEGAATESDRIPTDTSVTEQRLMEYDANYGITVTDLKKSPVYYAKDDPSVTVLEASASYPEIKIAGNDTASDKINAAITGELNTFLNFEKENADNAQEEYTTAKDFSDTDFKSYYAEFSYQLKRCDDSIISIVFSQDDYSGGAHGSHWSYGVTFHTATGDRLYLENLSSDHTAFRQMLSGELNAQAVLPAYENYISADFSPDIDASLLSNSTSWYMDRSGLTFISNPYVLGSYAAGVFEFNIPYEKLDGLKNAYTRNGPYICKLFPGISAQHDLNGDQTANEICYSILTTDADFSNSRPSLVIDGADFSAELEKLQLSYLWTGAYYLIDIDPEDHYTEIAISNENTDNPEGTCTHFFRYDTERTLVYLGSTPGIFSEDMQVRYNSNGNLILLARNGEPYAQ